MTDKKEGEKDLKLTAHCINGHRIGIQFNTIARMDNGKFPNCCKGLCFGGNESTCDNLRFEEPPTPKRTEGEKEKGVAVYGLEFHPGVEPLLINRSQIKDVLEALELDGYKIDTPPQETQREEGIITLSKKEVDILVVALGDVEGEWGLYHEGEEELFQRLKEAKYQAPAPHKVVSPEGTKSKDKKEGEN